MKVPISDFALLDLDAPVLPAYEAVIKGACDVLAGLVQALPEMTGMEPPRGIGKPTASFRPAVTGNAATTWRMRGTGRSVAGEEHRKTVGTPGD